MADSLVPPLLGLSLSLLLFLWRTSQPHIAVVGQLPGSEHFRNVERFPVVCSPIMLSLRVDESLYFPNARYLEDRVMALVSSHPQVRHVVLMCPGVNLIDASALESLEAIAERLKPVGELCVKGDACAGDGSAASVARPARLA